MMIWYNNGEIGGRANTITASCQPHLAYVKSDDQNIDLEYSTIASAVYSSNIEGNTVDLNSFMNYHLSKKIFKPTNEIKETPF